FVAGRKRDGKFVFRIDLDGLKRAAIQRPVAGEPRALRAGIDAERGKERRGRDPRLGACLQQAFLRCRQQLVCLEEFLLQSVEFRVMKYLPPRALGNGILRSCRLPRPFAFPGVGNLRSGAFISRSDGAAQACEQRRSQQSATTTTETRSHGEKQVHDFVSCKITFSVPPW